MENTERKYKEGARVLTPNGFGEVWEHAFGFYSVFIDGQTRCTYWEEGDLILLSEEETGSNPNHKPDQKE